MESHSFAYIILIKYVTNSAYTWFLESNYMNFQNYLYHIHKFGIPTPYNIYIHSGIPQTTAIAAKSEAKTRNRDHYRTLAIIHHWHA